MHSFDNSYYYAHGEQTYMPKLMYIHFKQMLIKQTTV